MVLSFFFYHTQKLNGVMTLCKVWGVSPVVNNRVLVLVSRGTGAWFLQRADTELGQGLRQHAAPPARGWGPLLHPLPPRYPECTWIWMGFHGLVTGLITSMWINVAYWLDDYLFKMDLAGTVHINQDSISQLFNNRSDFVHYIILRNIDDTAAEFVQELVV